MENIVQLKIGEYLPSLRTLQQITSKLEEELTDGGP